MLTLTQLSWHPANDALLAFGLEDGYVGVYDVIRGMHTVSAMYHSAAVLSLSWRHIGRSI